MGYEKTVRFQCGILQYYRSTYSDHCIMYRRNREAVSYTHLKRGAQNTHGSERLYSGDQRHRLFSRCTHGAWGEASAGTGRSETGRLSRIHIYQFDFTQYDYVVDAVDTVTAKLEIIMRAKEAGVPVISCIDVYKRQP